MFFYQPSSKKNEKNKSFFYLQHYLKIMQPSILQSWQNLTR